MHCLAELRTRSYRSRSLVVIHLAYELTIVKLITANPTINAFDTHACFWSPGNMRDIGTLSVGTECRGHHERGQVPPARAPMGVQCNPSIPGLLTHHEGWSGEGFRGDALAGEPTAPATGITTAVTLLVE